MTHDFHDLFHDTIAFERRLQHTSAAFLALLALSKLDRHWVRMEPLAEEAAIEG